MRSRRVPGGVIDVMELADGDFYRKHAAEVLRLSSSLVGPADAEDVVVTAFLDVTRSRRWVDLTDEEKRRYLYRAVVNQARSWARSNSRRQRREALWAATEIAGPEYTPRPEVWAAVSKLSPRQRASVFLVYWSDLTAEDAARTLGITSASVRRHLARARQSLRRTLDG